MEKKIKIGVFICHCGSNIGGILNIPKIVKYCKKLKHVVLVDEGKWSCSSDYLEKLKNLIKKYQINRIVIASCSARTHEYLFKKAVKNSGVNPYLLEFVSIREQVSWVHMNEPEIATEKAKDLIKMGVAKAALLEEGFETKLKVKKNCLIIGGGISGINAALSIANQGFKAFIIENKNYLGGLLNNSSLLINDKEKKNPKKILFKLLNLISKNKNITVFINSKLDSLKGYIGNYIINIKKNKENFKLHIDTIVVSTGMQELKPINHFFYKNNKNIISQLELEKEIFKKKFNKQKKIIIINCIDSKNKKRGCCNLGCHISLKNAISLKKINKKNDITILYRDLSVHIKNNSLLYNSKKIGIKFIRFSESKYPEIKIKKNIIYIKVFDILIKKTINLIADKIILTSPFVGNINTPKIKKILKVSTNNDNFFQEAHVKLNPLAFSTDGIALSGCAKYPMFLEESFNEGLGAAMKVSIPMNKGYTKAEGIVAYINNEKCIKCKICIKNCPYKAIISTKNKIPKIVKALCRGCGLCAADCPNSAITIIHYSNKQILAQINAVLEYKPQNKIIGFVCHWCALGGVDMAGVSRLQYPTNIRLIRVMCSARISIKMIKLAFKLNAGGIIIIGCEFPTCHYIIGNYSAKKRINKFKKNLKNKKQCSKKLWLSWCSAADGPKFSLIIKKMVKELNLNKEIL